MPSFRGIFFLKRAKLSVSVFRPCADFWVLIEKNIDSWALFWKSVAKIAKKTSGIQKLLDYIVAF